MKTSNLAKMLFGEVDLERVMSELNDDMAEWHFFDGLRALVVRRHSYWLEESSKIREKIVHVYYYDSDAPLLDVERNGH